MFINFRASLALSSILLFVGTNTSCRQWVEQSTMRHVGNAAEVVDICESFLPSDNQSDNETDKFLIIDKSFGKRFSVFLGDISTIDNEYIHALTASLHRLEEHAPQDSKKQIPAWVSSSPEENSATFKSPEHLKETQIANCNIEDLVCFRKLLPSNRTTAAYSALLTEATILRDDTRRMIKHATTLAETIGTLQVLQPESTEIDNRLKEEKLKLAAKRGERKLNKNKFDKISPKQALGASKRAQEQRRLLADKSWQEITTALKECTTNRKCNTAISELPKLVGDSAQRLARIESHAVYIREDLRVHRSNGDASTELEIAFGESMGRLRHQVGWFERSMPIIDALSRKDLSAFTRAYFNRGLGLAARLALDAISMGIDRTNNSISELDKQLYGLFSITRLLIGRRIDGWTELAFLKLGEQASKPLCRMNLSPEVVIAEACNGIIHSKRETSSFVNMLPVYRGLARGMKQNCSSDLDPPSSTTDEAPPSGDSTSSSGSCSLESDGGSPDPLPDIVTTELFGDWSSSLAYHVAQGKNAAPTHFVDPGYRLAYLESLMNNRHLLTDAFKSPDTNVSLRLAVVLAPQIDIILDARRIEVTVDASQIAEQIERVLESSADVRIGQAQVLESVKDLTELDKDSLSIQWLCNRIHDNPNLGSFKTAKCLQHGMSSIIATISISAEYPNRLWRVDGDDVGELDGLQESVNWLGELLKDPPGNLEYVVLVEGLASRSKYRCEALARDFEKNCEEKDGCGVEAGIAFVELKGEKTTCTTSGNPLLGYMRGRSFAKALKKKACKGIKEGECPWDIQPPSELSAEKSGPHGKKNQKIRLLIRPKHDR